ncbi:MAG: lipoyl protein ligase domain-containing protein, partial [Caldimicrobium sp.]
MRKLLVINFLNPIKYTEALDLQKRIHTLRVNNVINDVLILLEHYPVITSGRFGKESNLLKTESELKELGIEYFRVDRGGDITYHGPGQLVGYLIFKVEGVKNFILKIERGLVKVLSDYGIKADLS